MSEETPKNPVGRPKKLTGAAKAAAEKKAAAAQLEADRAAPTAPRRSAANTGPLETAAAATERTAGPDAAANRPVVDEQGNSWPSWRYGPDGASGIFNHAAEVPKGWKDHPGAFDKNAEAPSLDL